MFAKLSVLLAVAVGLTLLGCSVQGAEISWVDSLSKGLEQAKAEGKPLMVDFYTDWCGWCKKLDQDTYSSANVQGLAEKFVCVKVDGDKDQADTAKYGVRGYPTIIFLNADGKEINRNVGYSGPDEFVKIMEETLKK